MDYNEFIHKEGVNLEETVGEAAADILYRKELLKRGPDPDRVYTIEDLNALPEGFRAELVDGRLIYLEMPTAEHQEIAGEMHLAVANYIRANHGGCKVYIPPYDVHVNNNDKRVLQPDLTVICDRNKLDQRGCHGAPDWVVEVTSPSSRKRDLGEKLFLYREAGVREYWVINPVNRMVIVYVFEESSDALFYSFDDEIPCYVISGLKIRLSEAV